RVIRNKEPLKPSSRLSSLTHQELVAIATQRRLNPDQVNRVVKGELDWIVMKALEKDRTRRYESANGLAADLQRYLANEVVTAAPPTLGYQLKKYARRHRMPLTIAAFFVSVLFAGIVTTTWQALRATKSAGESRKQSERAQAAQRIADLNAAATRR